MSDQIIELGDRAKDRISSYTGIVTARTEFLNGCVRFLLDAEKVTKEGKPIEPQWVDDTQIEIIDKHAYGAAVSSSHEKAESASQPLPVAVAVGGPRDHNPAKPDAPTR